MGKVPPALGLDDLWIDGPDNKRFLAPLSLLVDGHGNFGSVDSDRAAAMRYTEAGI